MRFIGLAFLFCLILPGIAAAQFFSVEGAFVPTTSYHKKSGEEIKNSEANYRHFSVSAAMPFYFSRDSVNQTFSVWMGVINAGYTQLPFENIPTDFPEEIIRTFLLINNMQKLKGNNYLSTSLGFGIMGEREHINQHTLIFMTGINYYKKFWDALELGAGLFVTNMFGSIFLFPMPHFQLQLGKKTIFKFNQGETSLEINFSEIFSTAIVYKGSGTFTLVQRSDSEGDREKKIFQASQQVFGLRPKFKFKKGKYVISSVIGQAYNRNYRLVDRKFTTYIRSMFKDTPYTEEEFYVSLQINYRFF